VYVLDQERELVPVGVVGELYIGGAGVSAGYLNQPERTGERFVANPYHSSEEVMYRTGDLVRYLEGGEIEFLGRADDQVKVRGYRVELGEVEAGLRRQRGVKQAVVVVREEQLVGYVVGERESNITGEELRERLKEELPEYMVPGVIGVLERMPLTANGKVDRKGLPQVEEFEGRRKEYQAPRTPTEQIVAQIWSEVLRRPQISVNDNFFDLGGHSLMATQVISRVREQFETEVALRTLFESPTLTGLANAIDSAKGQSNTMEGPIKRVSRDAYRTAKTATNS
jgi:acyl carrier protein